MKQNLLSIMAIVVLMSGLLLAGESTYAIKAGKIITMKTVGDNSRDVEVINHGVILIQDGKIEAVGPARDVTIPADYAIINASDQWVMPGIVEAHTHIGTEGGFNDMVMPLNPELRLGDGVNSEDLSLAKAVTGGVTTVHTMPGSGTNLGGFTVIIKTVGTSLEDMVIRNPGVMKATQAFNPERRGGDLGLSRMAMAWMLRQFLATAKAYTDAWAAYENDPNGPQPKIQPEWENMRLVFEGKIPTIIHTYEGWGVMETIRLFFDENNLKTIPTHTAGGGYQVGHEAGRRDNVHINIGPRLQEITWRGRSDGLVRGMGAEYSSRGVENLSINTDAVGWSHQIAPQEELSFQAAMSARLGLDEMLAMKGITINSARALGIEDRVGSLEVGKDADMVIKKGSLLDVTSPVDMVLIDGNIVYERKGADLRISKQAPRKDHEESKS